MLQFPRIYRYLLVILIVHSISLSIQAQHIYAMKSIADSSKEFNVRSSAWFELMVAGHEVLCQGITAVDSAGIRFRSGGYYPFSEISAFRVKRYTLVRRIGRGLFTTAYLNTGLAILAYGDPLGITIFSIVGTMFYLPSMLITYEPDITQQVAQLHTIYPKR